MPEPSTFAVILSAGEVKEALKVTGAVIRGATSPVSSDAICT